MFICSYCSQTLCGHGLKFVMCTYPLDRIHPWFNQQQTSFDLVGTPIGEVFVVLIP